MSEQKPHIVDAFLANQQLEQLQDYLQRGRALSETPVETLNARWLELMKAWIQDFSPKTDHREREDIGAELQLRGLEPPFDKAGEIMEQLRQKSREAADKRLRDPERLAQAEKSFNEQLADFEAKNKSNKTN
jgi:hypothetical protein